MSNELVPLPGKNDRKKFAKNKGKVGKEKVDHTKDGRTNNSGCMALVNTFTKHTVSAPHSILYLLSFSLARLIRLL
jgi:hypothetical protein